jgi:carnitine-CoA ligase
MQRLSRRYAEVETRVKSRAELSEPLRHESPGAPWSAVPHATLIDLVRDACEGNPERPAMIFEDGVLVRRRELLERAEAFAGALRARIQAGERVAILLGNRAEFMIAWLAVVANRAVLVSMNPAAQHYDGLHILQESGAALVITDEEHADFVASMRPSCPDLREVLVLEGPEPDGLQRFSQGTEPLPFAESLSQRSDITNIFFTSGTTGAPKGCMVDHEQWLRVVDVKLRLNPKTPEDRSLCCLQFFYSDPPWQLLAALQGGGALVVMRRFSVSRFWDVVRGHGVTELLTIASIPLFLLKAAPSPHDRDNIVKYAIQLAIPRHLHRELNDRWGFPWLEGYGSTEAGAVAGMPLSYAEEMTGSGSVGLPYPEVEVRITANDGEDVEPGEVGEIVVRQPGMMRGYLGRPDATATVLRDGWVHTGDLGRFDERGFLYFVGRTKDMIRRSGENLSAAEVEEVLRMHPKVLDAAVLPVPDELRGEEVKAYVQLKQDESVESCPPSELADFCSQNLAAFKVPRYIEYWSGDFPRTPSMRVKKEELRAQKADLTSGAWDRERDAWA